MKLMVVLILTVALGSCAPVVAPAGPAVAMPSLAQDHIVAVDGAKLPLRTWLPERNPPRAVILALHGFNMYSDIFAPPGAFLAERGIAIYAYDQRGFGGAPGRGYWPGIPALAQDLRTAAQVVRRRYPSVPLFLLGESMGGAVAMVTMAGPDPPNVDGIILSAPAVWGRSSMPWYQTTALWIAAHTFPWGRVTGQGLGIKASDNEEMLRALGRDPMVIKQTRVDAVFGLVGLMDAAMVTAGKLNGLMLVLYGEHDQLIPPGAIWETLARLPAEGRERRRLALYASGYHMLLRDVQAEIVWRDIDAWIADPNAPLPSNADVHATEAGSCQAWNLCAIVPKARTRSSVG